jgi:clan AA aspartic protease
MAMTGTVTARPEAVLALTVHRPHGASETVSAIIDTGFTGVLVLPADCVTRLGLPKQSGTILRLADGVPRSFDQYEGEVEWGGARRTVLISSVGQESLVGRRLPGGYRLIIDVTPGGAVEIVPLSSPTGPPP